MTVIRPNSVSGITSITAQANEINFFRSNGALAGLQLNGVNFNTTTGVSTFNNLNVGGVLTYEDVTNVDSIGVITARSGIKVLAGGINAVGVVTATSFVGNGSQLTGISGGISNIVEDTSPQLGGHLDVNDFQIKNGNQIYEIVDNARHKFSSGGNQIVDINGNGVDFKYGNNTHADDVQSRFGNSNDLRLYHNGTHSYVQGYNTGNLYVGTTHSANLILISGNTGRWSLSASGHLLPEANNTYDIGSSSNRVRNIYTADLHCSNKGSSNDVDGTWGDYTIQEGENDLFLINNRNGKKYKFNLTEVS